MSAEILAVGIAAVAGLFAFVGYSYGARAKALAVKYEQESKELYAKAHNEVLVKLVSIKAEIAKIESEIKVPEAVGEVAVAKVAIINRLKALL